MSFQKKIESLDLKITRWMRRWGIAFLRYTLAIVFIWFGLLKILQVSPAHDLVAKTVYWVSPIWFVPFLGGWEIVIGILFLIQRLHRIAIGLMAVQMLGTFLPLILLPNVVYGSIPLLTLTLEGQYIVKNLVFLAAALVIGSQVRTKTANKIAAKEKYI